MYQAYQNTSASPGAYMYNIPTQTKKIILVTPDHRLWDQLMKEMRPAAAYTIDCHGKRT